MSAEFVAAMEDVLEFSEAPYDPKRPQVNFDETSKQLIAETRVPLPPQPGQPGRYDYAYQRNGTRNLLMFCEPQVGWRHMVVTAQRTMEDCAEQRRWLVDTRYPEAEGSRGVLDHLNTHKPASLYEAFAPAEARRMVKKLALHDTPKHGSWLNRAESELRILQRPCWDRRIPDAAMRTRESAAYEDARNAAHATLTWRIHDDGCTGETASPVSLKCKMTGY